MIKIAVLGLGVMGLPMATRLANDFDVLAYDVPDGRRKLAEKAGLKVAADTPEAVERADVALVTVRNAVQLEALLYGPRGIAAALPKSAVVILTSTVGIAAVESVAVRLEKDGIGLVDAPVSGKPTRAGEKDLFVACGTLPRGFEKVREVLRAMAGKLVLVGDEPGKDQALRTVNQLLCGVHIAAAGEALTLASKLGPDQRTALEVLMSGTAESFMLGRRKPRAIEAYEGGDPDVTSRLDIFVKDIEVVTSAAKDVGMATPVVAAIRQLYLMGYVRGQGAMDDSAVIRAPTPDSEGWDESRFARQFERAIAQNVEDRGRPWPLARRRGS